MISRIIVPFLVAMLLITGVSKGHCIEIKNGRLICKNDECVITKNNISFSDLVVTIKNFRIRKKAYTQKFKKGNYYSELTVRRGDRILWETKSFLDPSGNPDVGIHSISISPGANAVAFMMVGNYQYKLFIVNSTGTVNEISGGPSFTWENHGRYIFSMIAEDIPLGFLIYDTVKQQIVFKTDKYIYAWKEISDGTYNLDGGDWDVPNGANNNHTCYSINLGDSKIQPKLNKIECMDSK